MKSETMPKVLIAPLNWGLGHATRSSAIIMGLEKRGIEPVLAASGISKQWLTARFPHLTCYALPDPGIKYSNRKSTFFITMLRQMPDFFSTLREENREVQKICEQDKKIGAVISDHRLGVYHSKLPSYIIVHQINIPLPFGISQLINYWHQRKLKRYKEVWIPDYFHFPGLSGKMGHINTLKNSLYLGPLVSNFPVSTSESKLLLVILSGPEPQRSILETKLFHLIQDWQSPVAWVRGTNSTSVHIDFPDGWHVIDFAGYEELEPLFSASKLVISRSGYSTLMDLHVHGKPALLIPTPGQPEQEYLCELHHKKGQFISCEQNSLSIEVIEEAWQKAVSGERISWNPLLENKLDQFVNSLS
jgi:UDP-N-acetylglucosamine transferase subunit ALG13